MAMMGRVDYRVNYSGTHTSTHTHRGVNSSSVNGNMGLGIVWRWRDPRAPPRGRRWTRTGGSLYSAPYQALSSLEGLMSSLPSTIRGGWQLTVYCFGPTKESLKNFGFHQDFQRKSLISGTTTGLDVSPSVQSSQLMYVSKERQQMDTPTTHLSPLCTVLLKTSTPSSFTCT